MNSFCFFFF